jgi:hypothetical protein
VTFVDGRKKRVHFFASRLKYSRFAAVTLVENERVETIVRCLARDFVAIGGLPPMAVFDRQKNHRQEGRQRARRRGVQREDQSPYPNPCTDCAVLQGGTDRISCGSSFGVPNARFMLASDHSYISPTLRTINQGARCARVP